jgi:hypothetical protein
MAISTNCPGCQAALSFGEQLRGKKVRCKKCSHVFVAKAGPSREREEEGNEGTDARKRIQRQPSRPQRPAVLEEEQPARPPRRKRSQDEEPPVRSLRRNRTGLLLGLILGALVLLFLGGGAVLAIVLWGPSWNKTAEALDRDFSGSWPVPQPPGGFAAGVPEDSMVTLHVAAVADESTRETIYDKAATLADGGHGSICSTHLGDRMTILLGPVRDPQACANKIDFGTVRRVDGRIISVVAHKVEGLPPNADAVTKAIHDLKSPNFTRRLEAARRLKSMAPNERRAEVARALQDAMAKDTNTFSRQEVVAALAVWGDKDSVPALLNALSDENPFTRKAVMHALVRFKDERACEPLAQRLEDIADRQEAVAALKAMGPMAEKAVLKQLESPDHWVSWEACKVLRVIGTKESLPALQRAAERGEAFVPDEARGAIRAIQARSGAAR